MTTHPRRRPTPRRLTTITSIQVGFDLLRFNIELPPRGDWKEPSMPETFGVYRRVDDQRHPRGPYERIALYKSDSPFAPLVDINYRPRTLHLPPCRVSVRAASIATLLHDLDAVEMLLRDLALVLGVDHRTLVVSECELTIDFPLSISFAEIGHALYTPRTRRQFVDEDNDEWFLRGSPRSAVRIRVYRKTEGGVSVHRVELICRRDLLRQLGVNAVDDLRRVPWADVLARNARWVEFSPPRRGPHVLTGKLIGGVVRAGGIHVALHGTDRTQRRSPARRERIRRRLRPSPLHHAVIAAVGEFERSLHTPPAPLPGADAAPAGGAERSRTRSRLGLRDHGRAT